MAKNLFPHLNSPLRINNVVFQNRLLTGPSSPIFTQASENFPCDSWVDWYSELAKAGPGGVLSIGGAVENHMDGKEASQGHMSRIDINDMCVQHRFAEIAECIKAAGAVPGFQCMAPMEMTLGYDVSAGVWSEYVEGDGSVPMLGQEAPKELIMQVVKSFGESAQLCQTLGFQMCQIHMAYRNMFLGRFLSRYTNKRTDEFGGCLENRAKVPLMVFKEIKDRCGKDFLINIAVTATEPKEIYGADGITPDELCRFLKMADGLVDMVSIRGHQIDFAQGPSFVEDPLPCRSDYKIVSKFIKDNNLKIKLVYVCGAHDLRDCEDLIASGDADLVESSRAFVTNPDYATKMREGRPDDVVPCLRCSRCHHDANDRWSSVCSVNPVYSFEERVQHLVSEVKDHKNIAIIGGGCAGLKCAMELADRGHDVTIFEKEAELGGQLNIAGVPYVKWTVKKFRDYLVYQVEKRADKIKVVLNHEVKPGELSDEIYDAVIVAIGAKPIVPNIPGIENAMPFDYALTHLDEVKGDVVIVGGGEVALETGLHLVKLGHKAKCIEMQGILAPETPPVHFRRAYRDMWEHTEGFSWELLAKVTKIDADGTVWFTQDGLEKSVKADTVICSVGTYGLYDEAMAFAGNPNFRMIGDCYKHGNISTAMRHAYYTAHNL